MEVTVESLRELRPTNRNGHLERFTTLEGVCEGEVCVCVCDGRGRCVMCVWEERCVSVGGEGEVHVHVCTNVNAKRCTQQFEYTSKHSH